MKKIIALVLIVITNYCNAQDFKLTANNFIETSTIDKNYFIIEVPSKTQVELFKKAKLYFTGNFKGMKNDGYNEVEPEQIVIDLNGTNTIVTIINWAGANVWCVTNRYEINFKAGKIMIKPNFTELTNTIERNSTAGIPLLFNKKGEAKKDKAIKFIEEETNEFVRRFSKAMQNDTSKDW